MEILITLTHWTCLNWPLPVCWCIWTVAQMSSCPFNNCHTGEWRGSSLGLHLLKVLQFTKAASSESSQHRLSLFFQRSCFGTDTSSFNGLGENKDKSSQLVPSASPRLVNAAISDFSSVDVVCSLHGVIRNSIFIEKSWLGSCLLDPFKTGRPSSLKLFSDVPLTPRWREWKGSTPSPFNKMSECSKVAEPVEAMFSSWRVSQLSVSVSTHFLWFPSTFSLWVFGVGWRPFVGRFTEPCSNCCCNSRLTTLLGRRRLSGVPIMSSFSNSKVFFLLAPTVGTKLDKTSSKGLVTRGKRHCMEVNGHVSNG